MQRNNACYAFLVMHNACGASMPCMSLHEQAMLLNAHNAMHVCAGATLTHTAMSIGGEASGWHRRGPTAPCICATHCVWSHKPANASCVPVLH